MWSSCFSVFFLFLCFLSCVLFCSFYFFLCVFFYFLCFFPFFNSFFSFVFSFFVLSFPFFLCLSFFVFCVLFFFFFIFSFCSFFSFLFTSCPFPFFLRLVLFLSFYFLSFSFLFFIFHFFWFVLFFYLFSFLSFRKGVRFLKHSRYLGSNLCKQCFSSMPWNCLEKKEPLWKSVVPQHVQMGKNVCCVGKGTNIEGKNSCFASGMLKYTFIYIYIYIMFCFSKYV